MACTKALREHSHRGPAPVGTARGFASWTLVIERRAASWTTLTVHRTGATKTTTGALLFTYLSHPASLLLLLLVAGTRDEALMADTGSELLTILLAGMLAALIGGSVLLCAMILDDCRDAAAREAAGGQLRGRRPAE